MKILLIEDDTRVADFITRGLKAERHVVSHASTGQSGIDFASSHQFDVIILDLMLPDIHGHELCQTLRLQRNYIPILMLTAMDALEDRVEGLRLGADDYLTKPFAFEELLARIEAIKRRAEHFPEEKKKIVVSDIVFDRDALTVMRAGKEIILTSKELAILELLLSYPGKVFSRELILSQVWGYSEDPLTNVVEVYVARLRKKIDDGHANPLIETMRGRGYRIQNA